MVVSIKHWHTSPTSVAMDIISYTWIISCLEAGMMPVVFPNYYKADRKVSKSGTRETYFRHNIQVLEDKQDGPSDMKDY